MPYPLSKLAYGLRCRLSDLSTPVERYNLQSAAGDVSICPPKLQIVLENLQHLEFACENGTVFASRDAYYNTYHDVSTKIEVVNDNVFIYDSQEVPLYFLDAEALKSNIFDHFVCNPTILDLKQCHVSKPFYETARKLFPKIRFLFLDMDTSFVNFTDLLTALPDLQTVDAMPYHNASWISEILQVKQHSLMDLTFTYAGFGKRDEFDNNLLLTFLEAQRPGFRLMLYIQEENVGPLIIKLIKFVDQLEVPVQSKRTVTAKIGGLILDSTFPTVIN